MFSGTILILKDQIIKKSSQFVLLIPVVLSYKENYGSETLFGADVDYFGDFYRTRSNSKKQQEEPLGSVCKARAP